MQNHLRGTREQHLTQGTKSRSDKTNTSPLSIFFFTIQITCDQIGAEGGKALAEVLKKNASLTKLNLSCDTTTTTLFIFTFSKS